MADEKGQYQEVASVPCVQVPALESWTQTGIISPRLLACSLGLGAMLGLAACGTSIPDLSAPAPLGTVENVDSGGVAPDDIASTELEPSVAANKRVVASPARTSAALGLKALNKGDYQTASASFNRALKMDIRNSDLQFLNALTYHMRALQGDAESFVLAEQGYQLAAGFDPSNWRAFYQLGLLYMDQRQFRQAQDAFALAALLRPRDRTVLYQLAAASYYAGDPASAQAVLRRLLDLSDGKGDQPRILQAMAITSAAAGSPEEAQQYLSQYVNATGGGNGSLIQARMADWRQFYSNGMAKGEAPAEGKAAYEQAQFLAQPDPAQSMNQLPTADMNQTPPSGTANPFAPPAMQYQMPADQQARMATFSDTSMVVVDVAIIGMEEDKTESRGMNLLSGLRVQFGEPGSWGFNYDYEKSTHTDSSFTDDAARTITRAIGIPAISYSLNIANSDSSRNEILARPSLVSVAGQTSKFFSGVDVNAAAVSGAAGDSIRIEQEIGVSLEITPEMLPDDMVKLKVLATRTFITQPSQSVVFQYRLDTTKTSVDASVAMKFGETLILSGLSERETEGTNDKVPGVGDVPFLKTMFSKRTKREFNKSVIILVTPRRPQYVNASPKEFNESLSKLPKKERAIERLAARQRDWFQPDPNVADVFRQLRGSAIYQEFRTGDYESNDWRGSAYSTYVLKESSKNVAD